jgi:adenylate kinase
MPPKIPMLCDNCSAKLYQRQDDQEETIRKRLEVYLNESAPLIKYYEGRGKFCRVCSDDPAEAVLKKIVETVSGR